PAKRTTTASGAAPEAWVSAGRSAACVAIVKILPAPRAIIAIWAREVGSHLERSNQVFLSRNHCTGWNYPPRTLKRHRMNERNPPEYRPCVGIMLVNSEGKVFVGKRIDNREGDWWQMPQGGVDEGEDVEAAAIREAGEEVGVRPEHLEIIG